MDCASCVGGDTVIIGGNVVHAPALSVGRTVVTRLRGGVWVRLSVRSDEEHEQGGKKTGTHPDIVGPGSEARPEGLDPQF